MAHHGSRLQALASCEPFTAHVHPSGTEDSGCVCFLANFPADLDHDFSPTSEKLSSTKDMFHTQHDVLEKKDS